MLHRTALLLQSVCRQNSISGIHYHTLLINPLVYFSFEYRTFKDWIQPLKDPEAPRHQEKYSQYQLNAPLEDLCVVHLPVYYFSCTQRENCERANVQSAHLDAACLLPPNRDFNVTFFKPQPTACYAMVRWALFGASVLEFSVKGLDFPAHNSISPLFIVVVSSIRTNYLC